MKNYSLEETVEKCRRCFARIRWLRHKETGKLAPIDYEPSERGNILIKAGEYRLITIGELDIAKEKKIPLYLSHYATCPNAEEFRGRNTI